jgi:hypothetical protein
MIRPAVWVVAALLLFVAAQCLLAEGVTVEKVEYAGWPNCYRAANGIIDLVVTSDVGPRVIRLGFVGERNLFKEYEDMVGKTGGDEWRIYGGHRLWHSPEAMPRTYFPDNTPVTVEQTPTGLLTRQPTEATTGITKQMRIDVSANAPHVRVTHILRNDGPWPIDIAAWALTVMAQNGMAIIPQPTRAHPDLLLPNRVLVLWPYTDMSDPRVRWGNKFITLRQDPNATTKWKLGLMANDGWAAYYNDGYVFLKRFRYVEGATYPDWGCSVETFTNNDMLELETVGPLTHLEPGEQLEHVENWYLFRDVQVQDTDESIGAVMPALLEKAGA